MVPVVAILKCYTGQKGDHGSGKIKEYLTGGRILSRIFKRFRGCRCTTRYVRDPSALNRCSGRTVSSIFPIFRETTPVPGILRSQKPQHQAVCGHGV